MDIDLVLAPVDASDRSETAVEYAITIAERYGADLHILHVLDEAATRRLETGDLSAAAVANQHRTFDEWVERRLPDSVNLSRSSVAGFSAARLSQTPGSVVLDAAEDIEADFLVVPRNQPTENPEEMLGKAALYVLEYADQPVLSV